MFSLALRLKWPDITIVPAGTAAAGLMELEQGPAELACLCPYSADLPLIQTIFAVRCLSKVPLMVLSQRNTPSDAVASLNMGADDYVAMPCDLTEILARAWALIRRSGGGWSVISPSLIAGGSLFLNPATLEVFLGQRRINLTPIETQVLHALVQNRATIMPTRALIKQIWGKETIDSTSRVKKCIQRLRKKLGDDAATPTWIANIHGVGYRFIGPASDSPQPHLANSTFGGQSR
jgi:two-component system KDP operon response regulator KdpE